jgi:manganese transport protein
MRPPESEMTMVFVPGTALPLHDFAAPRRIIRRGHRSFLRRMAGVLVPGLLVAVGYMDPGNWATDIAAGSAFGFDLLFVLVAASLAAIVLQSLALRLGIASGLDLAQACRHRYGTTANVALWLLAELAIVATDVAEVLGGAGHSTAAWTSVMGRHRPDGGRYADRAWSGRTRLPPDGSDCRRPGRNDRPVFPDRTADRAARWRGAGGGLAPDLKRLAQPGALALAVGIVGATVMPHNLYLHSSIVQCAAPAPGETGKRRAIRDANMGSAIALLLAMVINGAILTLGAGAFHMTGHTQVAGIDDAYRLLSPITGTAAAALFFGIALLASGQSSTFTGTLAGQIVLEGFLQLKIPLWQRRMITRLIAIVPAMAGAILLGDHAVGGMLVASQMVLSLQLPFAIWPLVRASRDPAIMGIGHIPPSCRLRMADPRSHLVGQLVAGI